MANVPAEFWIVSTFLFGAIIGSFINMAAYRLPRNISLITKARSFCPRCEKDIVWYDNFPIASFLILRGRCRWCTEPIPGRYLLTELITSALFAVSAYQYFSLNYSLVTGNQPWIIFAVQLFLIADMILLSVVDLEAWLIPIETTWPGIAIGFILAPIFAQELHAAATFWVAIADTTQYTRPGAPMKLAEASFRWNAAIDSFLGLVMGGGILWAIGFVYMVYSYFKNRLLGINERPREAMGLGDVHLVGMIGALLGWKAALETIFIGVLIGSVTGVSKYLWERIQRARLGDKYKPWQPTYEIPEEDDGEIYVPSFWPLLVMGLGVIVVCAILASMSASGSAPFQGRMLRTLEEMPSGMRHAIPTAQWTFDVRLVPVYVCGIIGLLLIIAFPFNLFLKSKDLLPQGSIVEKETGEKEEVMEGNYVPFGPSLAAAALIVAFYDPLIRAAAFAFANGSSTIVLPPTFKMIGQAWIVPMVESIIGAFSGVVRLIVPGGG